MCRTTAASIRADKLRALMAASYNAGLDAQVAEQRQFKERQKLFERAENLRHLSTAGSSDPEFLRDQEVRLLNEAQRLGMDPVRGLERNSE